MTNFYWFSIEGWEEGAATPEKFALGKQDTNNHLALIETLNLHPSISWNNAREDTKSFAIAAKGQKTCLKFTFSRYDRPSPTGT